MNAKKSKYYHNASIPAIIFFEILETDDLRLLIIKGIPKKKQLIKAWTNIFDEFFELKNDAKMRLVLKTKKEIIKIFRKIAIVEAIVLSLVKYHFPEDKIKQLVDQLEKGGISIDLSKPLNEELLRVLRSDLEAYRTRLKLEQHNLTELTKGAKSTFEDSLVNLESVIGFAIDNNVSLRKYIAYERQAIRRSKKVKQNG